MDNPLDKTILLLWDSKFTSLCKKHQNLCQYKWLDKFTYGYGYVIWKKLCKFNFNDDDMLFCVVMILSWELNEDFTSGSSFIIAYFSDYISQRDNIDVDIARKRIFSCLRQVLEYISWRVYIPNDQIEEALKELSFNPYCRNIRGIKDTKVIEMLEQKMRGDVKV